jgi:hypothetical protein
MGVSKEDVDGRVKPGHDGGEVRVPRAAQRENGALQTRDPGFFFFYRESDRGPGSALHHCVLQRIRGTRFCYSPPGLIGGWKARPVSHGK